MPNKTAYHVYVIGGKFDVSESSVHAAVHRVIGYFFAISGRAVYCLDIAERECNKRAVHALVRWGSGGLPDVIGMIDGCRVHISGLSEFEESYYNRKEFHSIVLQGICNADMVFIDVFAGFPGSAHDARMLRESFYFPKYSLRRTPYLK